MHSFAPIKKQQQKKQKYTNINVLETHRLLLETRLCGKIVHGLTKQYICSGEYVQFLHFQKKRAKNIKVLLRTAYNRNSLIQ